MRHRPKPLVTGIWDDTGGRNLHKSGGHTAPGDGE